MVEFILFQYIYDHRMYPLPLGKGDLKMKKQVHAIACSKQVHAIAS